MPMTFFSKKEADYLAASPVIDHDDPLIADTAAGLAASATDETDYIRAAYEFVRDRIAHSADIGQEALPCTASEVLRAGHGICFAKSHLLAALLRRQSIPAGFCYQKLALDEDLPPILILHGLNAVKLKQYDTWVRLDARGNKNGVNAQFLIDKEQLAFPVRPALGERDGLVIYPEPDPAVVAKLSAYQTRAALWEDLPKTLAYEE